MNLKRVVGTCCYKQSGKWPPAPQHQCYKRHIAIVIFCTPCAHMGRQRVCSCSMWPGNCCDVRDGCNLFCHLFLPPHNAGLYGNPGGKKRSLPTIACPPSNCKLLAVSLKHGWDPCCYQFEKPWPWLGTLFAGCIPYRFAWPIDVPLDVRQRFFGSHHVTPINVWAGQRKS